METRLSRRQLQRLALGLPAPLAIAIAGVHTAGSGLAQDASSSDATPVLAPTPACGDDHDEPTVAQTEGPFFTPDSPERTQLREPHMSGTPLLVTGYVYSVDCQPVAGALIDFWQADDAGQYDNEGYTLRGHQFTDATGRYELETVLPGLYPGRTRHIHVKVQAPGGEVLTTQIYFPDVPENATDRFFDPRLVMDLTETDDGLIGFFTFVTAE